MREILFRGKRKDNGEWIEGDLLHDRFILSNEKICRIYNEESKLTHREDIVIPETVGQYTGLNDNTKWGKLTKEEQLEWLKNHSVEEWNGKKIFEGDYWIDTEENDIYVVEYRDGGFCFVIYGICGALMEYGYDEHAGGFGECDCVPMTDFNIDEIEVIGNIHDTPELLKGEGENA